MPRLSRARLRRAAPLPLGSIQGLGRASLPSLRDAPRDVRQPPDPLPGSEDRVGGRKPRWASAHNTHIVMHCCLHDSNERLHHTLQDTQIGEETAAPTHCAWQCVWLGRCPPPPRRVRWEPHTGHTKSPAHRPWTALQAGKSATR